MTDVFPLAAGVARITDFAYDRAGRLATLTAYTDGVSGAQDTIYAYNGRGLQTNVTYEETGTVTMAYDPAGNMTKRTDEEGVVVDYLYDASNRLTERKKNGASVNVEKYAYDGTGRLETADKGSSGNPDAVSSSVFRYDDLSRVTSETQTIAEGTARVVSYSYDKGGNRTKMIHHSAATTANYSYDARERCTKIENGSTLLADYIWLGNAISKRETTCDYPGSTKPKFRTDFQRDGILRVSKVDNQHLTYDQATSGYNDLGEFAYTYDPPQADLQLADREPAELDG